MRKWLKKMLICPECLPEEIPLDLNVVDEQDEDILEGDLQCPVCKGTYPIRQGVAVVLPEASKHLAGETSGYNSKGMLSSYLWSHYCDYLQDPQATDAYQVWSSGFRETDGCALDIGCAVGRLSFELSKSHSRVIGIDTSVSFIQQARELMQKKKLRFDMVVEGLITEERKCDFNSDWQFDRVDFLVADALALPFPRKMFPTVTSINLLEKVPDPVKHMTETNRVLTNEDAMFVFSDPFSWDETISRSASWLGGTTEGPWAGRGIDNMAAIFSGKDKMFDPALEIINQGKVAWKIRKTENLWEYITSQFIVGCR